MRVGKLSREHSFRIFFDLFLWETSKNSPGDVKDQVGVIKKCLGVLLSSFFPSSYLFFLFSSSFFSSQPSRAKPLPIFCHHHHRSIEKSSSHPRLLTLTTLPHVSPWNRPRSAAAVPLLARSSLLFPCWLLARLRLARLWLGKKRRRALLLLLASLLARALH